VKVMQTLRSNITDESITRSIDTLAMLLKVWQKANYERSLQIVRKCKLAWSTVLYRGAPTTVIKGKKNKPDQTVIRSPPKPSRSPWLSSAERSELGNIYKDKWSALDGIRSRWVALESQEQHKQMNSFIREIKSHYEELNNISNSVHAKLGKRKHWIELVCKEDGFKPKPKKGESESFLLSAHFFSKTLTQFDNRVKRVFAPITYLPDIDQTLSQQSIWASLFPEKDDVHRISSAQFSPLNAGRAVKLWQIWADLFLPVFRRNDLQVEEPQPVADRNIYSVLLGIAQP